MKNFKPFVDELVTNWRSEKKSILESAGLKGVISNREVGDTPAGASVSLVLYTTVALKQ